MCFDVFGIRLSKSKVIKKGRREEVMEVLIREKRISVGNIGKTLGMSCRNVSSYLCYLRKEGVNIGTDSKGRKFIEKDEEIEEDSTDEGGLVTEGENVDEVVEEIVNDIQ